MKRYLFILTLFLSFYTKAQQVALVLSGGGAKGLAHAGVLKALEEHNIPIDYIVGTSMGSIVGGFYAAGYTPQQIKELALSQELQDWVDGVIDEKYQNSFDDIPNDPAWLTLKLQFDSIFAASIDPSLDRDFVLNINLAEKLQHASYVSQGNYDSLLVPFKAVASNIFTEKEVVLDSGVLYESIRASMAIPLLYRPVRINGELLFDGGVYNNFPVTPAREAFDPDVILGVNVGSKILDKYPKDDDEKILAESILFFMLNKGDPNLLDSTDVFLDIKLSEYSTLDFDKAKEIYEIGYQSTLAQMDLIKQKIARRVSPEEINQKREKFLSKEIPATFDAIEVDGFSDKKLKYITQVFNKNEPFDLEQGKQAYYRLINNDYFLNIFPSYHRGERYTFRLSGRSNPRLRAKIGGSLTSRNISYLYFGLDFKRLSRVLEQYSAKLYIGPFYESFYFKNSLILPGKKPFSFGPVISINHRDFLNLSDYLLGKPELTVLDRVDRKFGIFFGFPLSRKLGFSTEASYILNRDQFSNLEQVNTNLSLDDLSLKGYRFESKLYHNSFNYRQFASSGSKFEFSLNYQIIESTYEPGATSQIQNPEVNNYNWYSIRLITERYYAVGQKFNLGLGLQAVYSNQPSFGTLLSTIINSPGYYPLMDSRTLVLENFRSRKHVALSLKNVWSPYKNLQIRLEGFAFNTLESISGQAGERAVLERESFNPSYAASTGVVYHSLVGPIGFHVNYYDDDQHQWGALLQIGFLLFNDHSLE
ncbi:MAG: patatin-like phospholipase family protein [Reichenbachiella sp.]|uniref:patatin-like phospholipase family protein n=1 Tax=Reichenbachiella sp. TaxID=2184521 RepID=UPI003266555A